MYLYILSSFSQHLIYVQKRTSRTKSKKIGIIKFIHIPSLYLLAKPAEHTPLALFASSALIAHAVIAPMTSPVQWQNLTHITVGDWKYHLPASSRRPSPSARVVLAGASLIFSRVFFCTSRSRSCWFSFDSPPRCAAVDTRWSTIDNGARLGDRRQACVYSILGLAFCPFLEPHQQGFQ